MKYGTWCIIPSPEVVSVLAHNLDFVILDQEHGTASCSDIYNMTAVAQREDAVVLARPSKNDETEILHLLDCGVDGIIVPHVRTVGDVLAFLEYTNYPPFGKRGYTPFVYSADYGRHKKDECFKDLANTKIIRAIIIEDMEGVNNLHEMLGLGINMVYIGVYDLSSSLGLDVDDPRIKDICKDIVDMVKAAHKQTGAIFGDRASLTDMVNLGIDFACYKTDTAILFDAIKEMREW
jgi:4-hydroxy-2-oxoheptanedioate aldolase